MNFTDAVANIYLQLLLTCSIICFSTEPNYRENGILVISCSKSDAASAFVMYFASMSEVRVLTSSMVPFLTNLTRY